MWNVIVFITMVNTGSTYMLPVKRVDTEEVCRYAQLKLAKADEQSRTEIFCVSDEAMRFAASVTQK